MYVYENKNQKGKKMVLDQTQGGRQGGRRWIDQRRSDVFPIRPFCPSTRTPQPILSALVLVPLLLPCRDQRNAITTSFCVFIARIYYVLLLLFLIWVLTFNLSLSFTLYKLCRCKMTGPLAHFVCLFACFFVLFWL